MRRIVTHMEFKDYLIALGTPSNISVHPEDYEVIRHKFVHRHDEYADVDGKFVVAYIPTLLRDRPVIIRPSETAERIGCEG